MYNLTTCISVVFLSIPQAVKDGSRITSFSVFDGMLSSRLNLSLKLLNLAYALITSFSGGTNSKLTPKGLLVSFLTFLITSIVCSDVIRAVPSIPSHPAFDTSATNSSIVKPPTPACVIG